MLKKWIFSQQSFSFESLKINQNDICRDNLTESKNRKRIFFK